MKLNNTKTNLIATLLLVISFAIAFFSSQNMSLTMDEKAHIPSGYSYMAFHDYRLNPEHPPLAKDLSALPLLFLHLNFPTDKACWTKDVNGQWDCGDNFIFHSGNNPDQIIFWARIPMMLLFVFMGWFIFFWVKKLGGNKAGLLALTLFAFSPTFIGHGRLVTTDIASALGFLLATFFWVKFLKKPSAKNIILASIILGISLCLKFSTVLLIPSLGLLAIIYALLKTDRQHKWLWAKYLGWSALIGVITLFFVIGPIYQFHIYNYPPAKQLSDSTQILKSNNFPFKDAFLWTTDKPGIRAVSQYVLGVLMATQRVEGGNTTYFMGQVSGHAWKQYFPLMYLFKVPLAFHLLTLLAIGLWLYSMKKKESFKNCCKKLKTWLLSHLAETGLLIIFLVYWATSIEGNLNIGIRHILPTIAIMFMLVSLSLARFYKEMEKNSSKNVRRAFSATVIILMLWYVISSISAFPNYLSYYNELVGGSKNGYKIAVDSNYDWGQDLKRLAQFVEKNNIQKIKVAYFGGDNTYYRLGDRLAQTWVDKDPSKDKGWIAISATFLQEGRALPAPGFDRDTTFYNWLNKYKPIRVGNSIFVYHID